MSGHCKCGTYHEEDDDRLCAKCQQAQNTMIKHAPKPWAASDTFKYVNINGHRHWVFSVGMGDTGMVCVVMPQEDYEKGGEKLKAERIAVRDRVVMDHNALTGIASAEPGSVAKLVAVARESLRFCRCRGTGSYETNCTLCGDSTFDHECNEETRPCKDERCIALRTVLAAITLKDGA